MIVATALAFLALAVWAVLLFARGGFWRLAPDMLPVDDASVATALPSVLAIVPARDEAAVIGTTLPTLLSQDYRGTVRVLLVDDDSADGTAAAAQSAAAAAGRGERLTVLSGAPLPPGWTGKLWAMQQGFDWAGQQAEPADVVLFADADIAFDLDVLTRLVQQRARTGAGLVSLMVKLRAESRAERLLVPAFVFFFRMLYPFRWVRDPASACAAAAGGVMLADRRALGLAGGPAAIRAALIDDCALGSLMKRAGNGVWLGLSDAARSLRASPRFVDIRRMVVRTAYAELRHSPLRLVVALAGLALVFLVPPLAALFAAGPARVAGLLAYAAMTLAFLPMARFYRLGWTAPLLPLIAATYAAFTLESAVQHRRGRGGAWKGRFQGQLEGSAGS